MPVKSGDLSQTVLERYIYSSEVVDGGIFDRFMNYNNCQPEVVGNIIPGTTVQDCLTPSEASKFRPYFERI